MADKHTADWALEAAALDRVKQIIRANIALYQKRKAVIDAEIQGIFEHNLSNDPELLSDLTVNLDLQRLIDTALRHNQTALEKPYFGRIDFSEQRDKSDYSLYVGKHGINEQDTGTAVVDWRAPVASVYYESELGKSEYTAPSGKIPIDLRLKRTFEIERGDLLDYYETEIVANDDFLLKYLGKNKEAVLSEIIATIQKEQNEIIRDTPFHNIVVQGVAGSGKTTVAMHRISYTLYNYAKFFKPEQFYIIGSNRMLLGYITGLLPDLDVSGVSQMTMEELFSHLLEGGDSRKKITPADTAAFMGSIELIRALERFLDRHEAELLCKGDIVCAGTLVMEEREVKTFLSEHPLHPLEEKIALLSDRLAFLIRHKLERAGYDSATIRAHQKELKHFFGKPKRKVDLPALCRRFLEEGAADASLPDRSMYEALLTLHTAGGRTAVHLCLMAYIRFRLVKTELFRAVRHMVVDEAQDFNEMFFYALKRMLPDCTFTVMGDVSQNIHYDSGMNGWAVLMESVFSAPEDRFFTLSKSYRNTIEISNYAAHVLAQCSFETYPIDPIVRHGRSVEQYPVDGDDALFDQALRSIEAIRSRGLDTIAVICRTDEETEAVRARLSQHIEVIGGMDASFSQGVMALPIHMTKGLEFDAVLLWNPDSARYPASDADAKLLYVAITRALHELHVIYTGDKSPLLA